MPRRYRVCSVPDCPELVDSKNPCPVHGRSKSNWGRRDMAQHMREARAAKKAQPWCALCGSTEKLDAHHTAAGDVVVWCNACHVANDPMARAR